MQHVSDDKLLDKIVELLISRVGDMVQAVVLFGSLAAGHATESSDVDLLLVVEPEPQIRWTSASNIALRLQLDALFRGAPRRVDLWVRTTSQSADAGEVFGGVEFLAHLHGRKSYQRSLRFPLHPPRPGAQIILGHVEDAVDDAIRLYAAAIRESIDDHDGASTRGARLAARSAERAAMACMILHQSDLLRKGDTPTMILEKLASVEPELSGQLATIWKTQLRIGETECILGEILRHLARVPSLARLARAYGEVLALPREHLARMPSLKAPHAVHSPSSPTPART